MRLKHKMYSDSVESLLVQMGAEKDCLDSACYFLHSGKVQVNAPLLFADETLVMLPSFLSLGIIQTSLASALA